MAAWNTWLNSLHSRPLAPLVPEPQPGLEAVRGQALALLDDCKGSECERLRWRLNTAESAQDLWLLRGPVFQILSSQHCQSLATERINALAPAFRQWLPQRLVTTV